MPVKVCELRHIRSLDQLYDELQRQLPLPGHFGRNLDALYDSLANDVQGPFELLWRDTEEARRGMGADVTPPCWKFWKPSPKSAATSRSTSTTKPGPPRCRRATRAA